MNGVLLVGHGSKSDQAAAELRALADLVAAALPDEAVDLGFLELTDPPAGQVLDGLVDQGCRRIVVLPLMLLGAGHTKSDVPAIVLEARDRHPPVDVRLGGPLGVAHDLVAALGQAIAPGLPLLLIARGTSDPDANGDACKVARLLAEWTGAPFVHTAFTGVTGPCVADGLDVFARLGHRRIAVAFWFLCHGLLVGRARAEIDEFSSRTGVEVVDAGYLGPDERIVLVVLARYHEALTGETHANCDLCAFRAPWPGREARVGHPTAVGHSHFAADHRH
ncbi:MAG: sirohydrochlorin chelatase [Acidimicrobiales bacterium]